mmetsp:Transcript_8267/g.13833  ORF Transcript_8267/g.13833 Transcript_8267/m.13833 type:complete len:83 (+) Transcript_8267:98-346(+)
MINSMPLSEIYKLPHVRRDDFRIYKEALGIIDQEQKEQEKEMMIKRCQEICDPNDDILENILEGKAMSPGPDPRNYKPSNAY